MSEHQEYPYWKVIIGFTICPLMAGAFMVLLEILERIFLQQSSTHPWELYPVFMLLVSAVAFVWYGVPALLLALLYAAIRLYKSVTSYVFVIFAGGIGAHLWGVLINYLNSNGIGNHKIEFPYLPGLGPYGPLFLAAITSLLMAYLVLPKLNKAKN